MELQLVFPSISHKLEWINTVAEFESTDVKIVPFALSLACSNYNIFLKRTYDSHNNVNVLPYSVPSSTYFLMNEDRIMGAVNIRHFLNDNLLKIGGHISYGIRPCERRKGYATRMLSLALKKCKELGIYEVLVSCNKENVGSARTIQKNGGIIENEMLDNSTGLIVERYWIYI